MKGQSRTVNVTVYPGISNLSLAANVSIPVRIAIEEEITKLTADPASLVLNPGRSKAIKVTGTYKSGKTVPLSGKINWTVSSETLASVKGGTVKALAEGTGKLSGSYQGKGTVVIKAVCEGKSVSVRVTVK